MSRSGGQSEARPPVIKFPSKIDTHLSTHCRNDSERKWGNIFLNIKYREVHAENLQDELNEISNRYTIVFSNHQEAARGPLMTERTVSNGVQGKRMTPKVAIPLRTPTPHQQEDSEP
ncbi:hypothetical protein TNCV_2272791 [Trichonephila clavipes]|nr:hypothetical protein TNCV_2272791 [Trichonephila clavipes]